MRKFNTTVRARPHPYDLADDAAAGSTSDASDPTAARQAAFKRAIIETSIKVAAVQMGISLLLTETVLICVVPIGTIIAAVLAVIQLFTAQYTKRQVRIIIADTVTEIKSNTAATQASVKAVADQISDEEFANAQALATSGQPLDGFFDDVIGKNFTVAMRTIAKPIAKPFARAITVPVKLLGRQVLQAGVFMTHVVGDKKGEEKLQHAQQAWNTKAAHFDKETIQLAGDPVELTRKLHGEPAKYLIGTSTIDTARKKCRDLSQFASQQLTLMKTKALADMADPAYRVLVRINMAKLIRQDPSMLAKAQDVARIEAQAAATIGRVDQAVATGDPSIVAASGSGGILSTLAVIGGLFWLNK